MADQTPINLNVPSKYASRISQAATAAPPPTTEWLTRTWTITHSTLSMWRSARNVRITYRLLPPNGDGRTRIDDLVEYEPSGKSGVLKSVAGVDTQASGGGWDWRGKGCLFFVSSHWELLGWGESTTAAGKTERWAVTWFAPTLFTKEGVDIYSDCAGGLSERTHKRIDEALRKLEAREVAEMTAKDMKAVEIRLPWTEN